MTSTDQQYCLRWNNHQSTLMTTFENLLLNETLVDVTLVAEGQSVLAHKVVLSACSPYFESICTRFYDKHPVIVLKDVKHSELKALLDYMYKGELNISQDHLGSLLKTAESLQIKGLAESPDDNVTDKKKQSRRSPERTASPIPKKQKVSSVTVEKSSQPRSLSHGNLRTSERGSSISMTKHIVPSSPGEVPSPATVELDDYYEPSAVPVEPKPDPISEPPQRPSRPSSVSQDMDTSIKHSERNVSQIVKEEVLDDDMPIALDEDSQRFEGNEEDLTLDPGPSTSLDESGEGMMDSMMYTSQESEDCLPPFNPPYPNWSVMPRTPMPGDCKPPLVRKYDADLVNQAIDLVRGGTTVAHAARILGINRRTLNYYVNRVLGKSMAPRF